MRHRLSLIGLLAALAPTPFLHVWADEPAPAVVPGESKAAATRLDEAAQRLAEARLHKDAKQVAEASLLLQGVAENAGSDLVALKDGRSVRAGLLAQAALARLTTAELAAYRRRVDPRAQTWLDEATRTGDVGLLRRVAAEAFCSRPALAALTQLGDRAFAAGRFDEADGWWRLLTPLGPPAAQQDGMRYPDPPEELAVRTRAKRLLAHLFAGRAGWREELSAFAKRYPRASGKLAGRTGTYAQVIQEVADLRATRPPAAQSSWLTFGGDGQRGRVAAAPPRVLERLSQLCRAGPAWKFDLAARGLQEIPPNDRGGRSVSMARRLAFHPVVVGRHALVADARYVTAYDLGTGKADVWYDAGLIFGGLNPRLALPAPLDLRYTLTAAEGCVFARLGSQTVRDVRPDPRAGDRPGGMKAESCESLLVCLAVNPGPGGERRRWMVSAFNVDRKEYAVFEGAPLVADGRVYIAATRFEGDRVVTAVHCYPAHPEDSTPAPLWRTDVCETRELLPAGAEAAADLSARPRHHLLTLAGPRVVYCSHSGAVVALDGLTGKREWAFKYARREVREPADLPVLRELAPCLFAAGRLYAAPSDSEFLYCLDPATGATVWKRERLDAVHLLGVGQGKLIFTTWRNPQQGKTQAGGLRAVGADDGSDSAGWLLPDDGGGLAPFGRGLLLGELVLWPTARKPYGVFAVRQRDGEQPDNPSLLHRIPSGNLVYANGCLLVADCCTLHAFVPPEMLPDDLAAEARSKAAPPPGPRSRLGELVRQTRALRAGHEEQQAARVWQSVLADDRLRDLGVEERGLPQSAGRVREFADLATPAADLAALAGKGEAEQPPLSLPLWQACAVKLAPGETFLPPEVATGDAAQRVWSARGPTLVSRSRASGEVLWSKRLPFEPTWAAGRGGLLLAAGAGGVAAVRVGDGARPWTFLAPPLGRYPCEADGPVRIVCDVAKAAPLSDFHWSEKPGGLGRLFLVQGGRRLLALDVATGRTAWQRWAPGAGFAMPAPRGHIQAVFPAGEGALLFQTSGRRWLLDGGGAMRHEAAAPMQPWPRTPLRLGEDRVCVVVDASTVELLDVRTGKAVWTYHPSGKTTRSGEPPLVFGSARGLFVVVPENVGYRLQRLDAATGKPAWVRPPLLALSSLEPGAWLAGPRLVCHADAGVLTARSAADGSVAWRRPLPAGGVWRLEQAGDALLAWPTRLDAERFQFRWLAGSVQWRVGSLPGTTPALVDVLDARDGAPVQRINLEEVSLPGAAWLEKGPGGVCPSASRWREAAAAPGVQVWRDGKGLVAGLGDRVKVLAAAPSSP
jgi:outer membrane protein assembly factor BamB